MQSIHVCKRVYDAENEVEKKGCFAGKDSKIELVAETKPYFDDDKKGCFKKK